ncbi:PREDICTED: palladin-like [Priapulus caudatus]|uniref:Palladin-like n=1 Tax=Priapulus caudatus TaxID=37621 RepID=A0ABM1DVV6_PRICU|nr:PREDICTED: palladin-like [Priapulus caudatus]
MSDAEKGFSGAERKREIIVSKEESVAPKFVQLIADVTASEGERITFGCRVTGAPEPEVTWYRNGRLIESSPDFQIEKDVTGLISLTIPEVFSEDAGKYVVKASNTAGEAKCYALLIVKPTEPITPVAMPVAPVETGHPPEFVQLFRDTHAPENSTVTFECVVRGSPKPRVQWTHNGFPITNPNWRIDMEGDKHSLTIPSVQAGDAGRISISAENTSGKATCAAQLAATPPTGVAVYSQPMQMSDGRSYHHEARSSYSDWEVHKSSSMRSRSSEAWGTTTDATMQQSQQAFASSMTSSSAQGATSQPYVAVRPAGRLSWPAAHEAPKPIEAPKYQDYQFTVAATARPSGPQVPPTFSQPVKSQAATDGERILLEGVVTGQPTPTVTWYKDGVEITNNPYYQISYQTYNGHVSLSVVRSRLDDAGKYTCKAENPSGTSSSSAEVLVKAHTVAPNFVQKLQSKVIKEGEYLRFDVRVTGIPEPSVTWYRENVPIKSTPDFQVTQNGDLHSLIVTEAFKEDSGKFSVRAENEAGVAQCTADLIVGKGPMQQVVRTSPQHSASVRVVDRMASTQGYKTVTQQPWVTETRDTKDSASAYLKRTLTEHVPLSFPSLLSSAPSFVRPLKNVQGKQGHRVVLECQVTGHPTPEITWARESITIKSSPDFQITYNNGVCTLTIPNIFPEDTGRYTCTATNASGSKTTSAFLSVQRVDETPSVARTASVFGPQAMIPPSFIKQLGTIKLVEGNSAFFECIVRGQPDPEIIWSRRGVPIMTGYRYKIDNDYKTGTCTLTVSKVFYDDEGEYTCTGVNPAGEASTTGYLLSDLKYREYLKSQGIVEHVSRTTKRGSFESAMSPRPIVARTGSLPPAKARQSPVRVYESDSEFRSSQYHSQCNHEVCTRYEHEISAQIQRLRVGSPAECPRAP